MLKNVFSQFYNYVSGLASWKASAGSQKRIKLTSSMHFNMRSFSKNQHGVVAIVFVVLAVPLLLVISLAVNYTMGSKLQTSLQDAADAAALAAVSPGVYSRKNTPEVQQKLSSEAAIKAFNAMVPPDSQVTSTTLVTKMEPDSLTAVFTFTGKTNMVLQAAGDGKMSLGGTATAYAGQQTSEYIDLFVLIDVSQSMATGADPATQARMNADPQMKYCDFACHVNADPRKGDLNIVDTMAVAISKGYQLRIDIVKRALSDILQKAKDLTADPNVVLRIGLYTFNSDFNEIRPLTSDFNALKSDINNLSISTFRSGTNIKYALDQLNNKISANISKNRKTYAMLVTDAVSDSAMFLPNAGPLGLFPGFVVSPNGTFSANRCYSETPSPDQNPPRGYNVPSTSNVSSGPCIPDPPASGHQGFDTMSLMGIDPAWCQGIKSLGVTMTTLYVEFGKLLDYSRTNKMDFNRNEWRHIYANDYIIPKLPSLMSACASSAADAFVANDSASVNDAVNKIFEKYMFHPIVRLTH